MEKKKNTLKEKIKDNIITGIIVIVPVVIIGVLLSGVVEKLFKITRPLTQKMQIPYPLLESVVAAIIMVLVLAAIFFFSGLFLKTYIGKSFNNWIENMLLKRIPFYKSLKGIIKELTGKEKGVYTVVEVDLNGNNTSVMGLQTDTLNDGRCVVYVPFAPLMNVGQLHLVPKKKVKELNIPVKDATDIITRIGFQAHDLLDKKQKSPTA